MFGDVNKIMDVLHGGMVRYDKDTDKFLIQYSSESLAHLFGSTVEELRRDTDDNMLELVSECDRLQVEWELRRALKKGTELNMYFRVKNKTNTQKWCKLDGWQSGGDYFVILSGTWPETQLFHHIAEELPDDIFVIDKRNYNLLYGNQFKNCACEEENTVGEKCYQVLYGKSEPCEFCPLKGEDFSKEMTYEYKGRYFTTRFQEMDWNGVPAYIKYVRDITEEVLNTKEKERLAQYFETVVKHLPGGMAVVRHEAGGAMRPEYLSDGFSEMLDMSKEEAWNLYQGDALSGVHPDDRAYVREHLDKCLREKREKHELEYRLKRGTGGYIWVKVKFSVIRCEDGDARVYVDYHDITAEKRMKEQLNQQYKERIYQHYLSAGPDALILGHCNVTKNKIHEIVDHTNSGLLEAFGDVREAFFKGIGTFIEEESERKEFYSKYLNEPTLRAYESDIKEIIMSCFIKFPNQKVGKYVQFKVTLVETPDTGDLTGILTIKDITEKTIREKIFMQLSSINYDLVANVNLFTDTYEIISGGDENISEKAGINSERIRKVIAETVIQSEREKHYASDMLNPVTMLERLKKMKSYSFIYSVYNTKGEIRTKNMTVTAIDMRLGRVCFIRSDVTDVLLAERKAKEDLEKALTAAKKANRVKSDFLSSMSHDIRTPMNAIVGMTTLALANIKDADKTEEYLHKISLSSQHLLSLVNDILDMSQIEQAKIHLNHQKIRIEELIAHISSIMTSSAENAGLRFKIETGNFEKVRFQGDGLRIKQILINLLSNAFKFTMEGGSVLFRTEEIAPKKEKHVRYCFSIRDTGIGMSEEFQNHLFEPFIRNDKVLKVEGTGLGLSITKGLVDLMGGEIRVSSKLKEGTEFQVELEFEIVEDTEDERLGETSEIIEEEDLSGYHFLLVEDNEINSEILGEILRMRGATFTLKTDGLQAVNEFKNSKPGTYDAIFMDIQMPVMNGYEATREIRKSDHPDAKTMIILAMTANAFAEDVHAALEAGMDGHIAKPVDIKLLYSTISTMLKKGKKNEEEPNS